METGSGSDGVDANPSRFLGSRMDFVYFGLFVCSLAKPPHSSRLQLHAQFFSCPRRRHMHAQ